MVVQSIPIYYGAPNISEYIPSECYIDAREFRNIELLYEHLNQIDENAYQDMIIAGQKYLKSPLGSLHSYEGFADQILNLINEELRN